MLRVLIVEDIASMAAVMRSALELAGMTTEIAASGADAIDAKRRFRPDVVLIDLGLPDLDGLALVERFSLEADCGVIVVTGNDAEQDRVHGLDTGADDYLVKPVAPRELVARIRAVHRRLARPEPDVALPAGPPAMPAPRVTVDAAQRCLTGPGAFTTLLTEAEFAVLETLLDAEGGSVSREWLARVALKRMLDEHDRSVDQLVLKLRRKLARHGVSGRAILAARGLGYMMPEPGRFLLLAARVPRLGAHPLSMMK